MEDNYMKIQIVSKDKNLLPVRLAVTSFLSQYNVCLDEIMDVKTALSEAVTNCIEHAYENSGKIYIEVNIDEDKIRIRVQDFGRGIEDISMALTPTYTSKPDTEHAGVGLNIMESMVDELVIDSKVNIGTTIIMVKNIKKKKG